MKRILPSRISLILIVGLLLSIQTVQARPITRQQALENAHEFLLHKGINVKNTAMRQVAAQKGGSLTTGNAPYYVFNIGDGNGFVIASGDDCAYKILGYADKGSFDADRMPEGMKFMLDFYAEQISRCSNSPKTVKAKSSPAYPAVDALMKTEWGQEAPYNINCPLDTPTNKRCVTGCVATAMAQVMYYHRHNSVNEVVNDIPGYVNLGSDLAVEGVPKGAPIDWDNMLEVYNSNATEIQKQAVANLMLYCGTAVKMDYGVNSSGAIIVYMVYGSVNYFDYDDDMRLVERNDCTNTQWETMVYEELGKGNPIYYAGGNHVFVVDGHDGNGFVHINWGWDGWNNNFFRLTASYAGEETMDGYSYRQIGIFGAVPNGSFPRLTTTELTLTSSDVVENLASLTSIPVSLSMMVTNLTEETGSFEQAVGLYKLGKLQSVVSPIYTISDMAPGATATQSVSLQLESTLPPGTYTLVPVSRLSGTEKWRKNGNYDQFITLSIYGGSAHLTVGAPEQEGDIITFACDEARRLCVQYWDLNGDGAFSKEEAASVTSLDGHFQYKLAVTSFDELQYFTGLKTLEYCEFINCYNLASVVLPPNLETIENRAFECCTTLHHIVIPQKVVSINEGAFDGVSWLKSISVENGNPVYDSRNDCRALIETATNRLIRGGSQSVIPEDVVAIGPSAFKSCRGLTSLQIPQSVTSIGKDAFYYCKNMASINIPEGVTDIGNEAFMYCSALSQVTIPSSVTSLGDKAFSYCSGLTSVNFQASVTAISIGTFMECSNLTSFTIPSCVTSIGATAFSGCSSLTAITIPSAVTHIGSNAFKNCSGLTTVRIPNSVNSIEGNPFNGCSNLQSIVVDASNSIYESDGHNGAIIETATRTLITGCVNTVIPDDIVVIGEYAFSGCSGLTSIVIPSGVTAINKCAFNICKNLVSLTLPNSLTNIGIGAFAGCASLTAMTIPSTVTTIGARAFSGCTNLQSINIPQGVTSINDETFNNCTCLQSIIVPSGVTNIGGYAFCGCSSLQYINIPLGVTSIGAYAFRDCNKMTAVTIPSSVTGINSFAFQNCTDLTSIKCYVKNVFTTGTTPFNRCNNATLYVPKGLVDTYRATNDWNKITFIEEMPEIDDVNGDGSVSVADVVCLIDKILGLASDESYAYDVNNDEYIGIADVVAVIDAILRH